MNVDAIFVPQGAEYKAVYKGLLQAKTPVPPVFATPVGLIPLTRYLEQWRQENKFSTTQPAVLLMGLCGSLLPRHRVGDVVIYEHCLTVSGEYQECDRILTKQIEKKLENKVSRVRSLSCDRVISTAKEKHQLGKQYNTDVVDMEGIAALNVLSETNISVAMLRVVSDDSSHDIPNLSAAFNSDGALQTIPLATAMIQQPLGAIRLIQGAMQGLKTLQKITAELFLV
ncbi:MAG: phosphorylase [Chroococcales cyanobacterium]